MTSVYQSKEWEEAMGGSDLYRKKRFPLIGEKEIMFLEGSDFSEFELEMFKEATKKRGVFYGVIAPCVMNPQHDLLQKMKFKKISNYTILIDLKPTVEEIWHKLEKKSVRWGIKKADENKLTVSIADETDLKEFYTIYFNTANEGGFPPQSIDFLVKLRNTEISKLIVVKSGGIVVAGGLLLLDRHNKYSILNLAAASKQGKELQAVPFLYWTMIQYSKKQGLEAMDLGGYNKEVKPGHKEYAINQFKENFGGTITEQPFYTTSWKYSFFRWLRKMWRKK